MKFTSPVEKIFFVVLILPANKFKREVFPAPKN